MSLSPARRREALDQVADTLLPRASLLTRLLLRHGDRQLTRGEAGVLGTLCERPRRITELAESEALAQPTVTQLVARLEERGYVGRTRGEDDGRVVLVTLTADGRSTLEAFRAQHRGLMREHIAEMSDDEVAALVAATEALNRLIERLQVDAA
jgi:DNA-binding MarR family transcriptional regulator